MRVVGRVTFGTVNDELWGHRSPSEGSGPWTGPLLDLAEADLGPDWWDVELSGREALDIVLPFHAGEPCHGDRMTLIDAGGLRVREAARRLGGIEAEYARQNRSCWARIDRARREPPSRVILASAPIDHDEYRGLRDAPAFGPSVTGIPPLYCLDGRHRLLGWALGGALEGDAVIAAHVAGWMAPGRT